MARYQIGFHRGYNDKGVEKREIRYDLPRYTDECIEQVRKDLETSLREPLPLDPDTDFPNFTIYDEGEAVAWG